MPNFVEFLLPRSDSAVVLQLSLSVIVAIVVVLHMSRTGRSDTAWFVAGISCLWIAFMGFRSLH